MNASFPFFSYWWGRWSRKKVCERDAWFVCSCIVDGIRCPSLVFGCETSISSRSIDFYVSGGRASNECPGFLLHFNGSTQHLSSSIWLHIYSPFSIEFQISIAQPKKLDSTAVIFTEKHHCTSYMIPYHLDKGNIVIAICRKCRLFTWPGRPPIDLDVRAI